MARVQRAVALFNHYETCVRKLLGYPAVLCLTYTGRLMYAFRASAQYISETVFTFKMYTLRTQRGSRRRITEINTILGKG